MTFFTNLSVTHRVRETGVLSPISGSGDSQLFLALRSSSRPLGPAGRWRLPPLVLTCTVLAVGRLLAEDCNQNGISDILEIRGGSISDCNRNHVPDECEVASGAISDCNGNGIPDSCDLVSGTSTDCNRNRILDECDLASGTSADCNGNGILDDCDRVSGTSKDCNGNQVPDDCDLAFGTSADCNGNGIPDDCDVLPRLALTEPLVIHLENEITWGTTVAELDGDRFADVVLVHAAPEGSDAQSIAVLINRGDVTFSEIDRLELESGRKRIVPADVDSDGDTDLVVATEGGRIVILENAGDGRFSEEMVVEPGPFRGGGERNGQLAVTAEDLDGDGLTDVISVDDWIVKLYLNTENGFAPTPFDLRNFCPRIPVAGDIDGDGDVDVVVSNEGCVRNGYGVYDRVREIVAIFENKGGGSFNLRFQRFEEGMFCLKIVDADGDGVPDLGALRGFFFNQRDGTFGPYVFHGCSYCGRHMDIDGDGDQDLVGGMIACIQRDDRTFVRRPLISFNSVLPGDFDGDGLDDIGSFTGKSSEFLIRFNRTQPPRSRDEDQDWLPDECDLSPRFLRGDCTANGRLDISDAVCILMQLFRGQEIACEKSADFDDSGRVNPTDAIVLLQLLFRGGSAPELSFPECGPDGTMDGLGCREAPGCPSHPESEGG